MSCCCAASSPLCSCGTKVSPSDSSAGDFELSARPWLTPPSAQSMSTQQRRVRALGQRPYHARHTTEAATNLCFYGTFVGEVTPLEDDEWFDAASDLDDTGTLPGDAEPTTASQNLEPHHQHHSQGERARGAGSIEGYSSEVDVLLCDW